MFWNRKQELATLGQLDGKGGLAVVWGRRRIGKTHIVTLADLQRRAAAR